MTTSVAPHVHVEQHHASLRVADLPAAIDFYIARLGFVHEFSWGAPPSLAGVNLGDTQLFLERGAPAPGGCAVYFVIGDADELYEFHRVNGVEIAEEPGDRPWGLRDYTVRDLDGYALTFGHRVSGPEPPREAPEHPEPPLVIERMEVVVRLEQRLTAVLMDLAARKGMTVSSCLEETLLHTFEPVGNGVASPHTRSDLQYIQELKRKHGLEYDCHASYRFVERDARRPA